MSEDFEEKRRFIRMEIKRLAKCGRYDNENGEEDSKEVSVELLDLSLGGACILGDEKAMEGILALSGYVFLQMPAGEHTIKTKGQVIWTMEQDGFVRAGISFVKLPDADQKLIRMYLYERGIRNSFAKM